MVMDADRTLTAVELKEITAAATEMAPHLRAIVEDDGPVTPTLMNAA
jgi:hypothetical protein